MNQKDDPAAILLRQSLTIVTGARRGAYGNPEDSFECIANLWDAYIARRRAVMGTAFHLAAADVAAMMALMKTARLAETPSHADSWRDIAGYAACGARASGADLSDMPLLPVVEPPISPQDDPQAAS